MVGLNTDLAFQFSNERNEELKTTAVLQLNFAKSLEPKKGAPIEVAIEYLSEAGIPVPHHGAVTVMCWGQTEVFDPESNAFERVAGQATASIHFVQKRFDGQLSIRVAWTARDGSQQERIHRCAAGQKLNQQVTEEVAPYTPSLATYLKAASPAHPLQRFSGSGREAEAHAVGVLLRHIYTKLRWGFGNFWANQGPKAMSGAKALSEVNTDELNGLTPAQLDEAWAQLISEAVVGTCYQGPGSFMEVVRIPPERDWPDPKIPRVDAGHSRDASVMQATLDKGTRQEFATPFIPVVFACQQLASWALLYRGYKEVAENPVDAELWDTTGNVNGAERVIGYQGTLTAKKLQEDLRLRPGTCLYVGKIPEKKGEPPSVRHVAFTLRGDTTATRLQLGDTGGWVSSSLGSGQNFDTGAIFRMAHPCDGILVCPTAQEREDDLRTGIKALRRAHPLAAGQLLIARRGSSPLKERLLWMSKLLPLFDGVGDEKVCFYLSKLCQSLRSLPFSRRLEVRWRVWAPSGDSMAAAVSNPSGWMSAAANVSAKPVIEIGTTRDGDFEVLQRTKQHLGSGPAPRRVVFEAPVPFGAGAQADVHGLVEPMGAVPGYFR